MTSRLISLIAAIIVLTGCGTSGTKPGPELPIIDATFDSTMIFNGKDLDGWEITNFGPQGPVYVSGNEIILGMGEGCTGITYKRPFPTTNYMITLDAKRVAGNDFFCGITFPVGKDFCSFIVGGWGGTTIGISSIDGKDAAENSTTSLMKFEKDRWYNICVKVKNNKIETYIDTVKVVDFKTGSNKLTTRPEVELSKPFGITSWSTTAAIRNIRLKRNIE